MTALQLGREREPAIRDALRLVWRNLPDGVSTFGPCERKCGSGVGGRGSGPCLRCIIDDLAALVGKELADRYVDAVRTTRDLERDMLSLPNRRSRPTKDDMKTSEAKFEGKDVAGKVRSGEWLPGREATGPRATGPEKASPVARSPWCPLCRGAGAQYEPRGDCVAQYICPECKVTGLASAGAQRDASEPGNTKISHAP